MARHKVEINGVNTANIKVLDNEEMTKLFSRYQQGDVKAKELLINGNLKLVLSILKKYNNRTDNMDDLFQVGCIGLIKAIYNFDLSHEVKFSTYAVPMIIGEIQRFIRDDGMVHISRKIKEDARKIAVIREQLEKTDSNGISVEKIAENTGLSKQDIIIAMEAENPTTNRENESVIDFIEHKNAHEISVSDRVVDNLTLQEAIKKLSEEEKRFIRIRYLEEKTQSQTAQILGKNQVAVSRYEKKLLLKLRRSCMI